MAVKLYEISCYQTPASKYINTAFEPFPLFAFLLHCKKMDFNMTDVLIYRNGCISNCKKNDKFNDMPLSLDYFGPGMNNTARVGHSENKELPALDDGCTLFLGLGPTPSFYCNKTYPVGVTEQKESSAEFSQSLGSHVDSGMLQLGLSSGTVEPAISLEQSHVSPASLESQFYPTGRSPFPSITDEGSSSAKRNFGGYMPSLLLAPRHDTGSGHKSMSEPKDVQHHLQFSPEPSATTDCSVGVVSDSKIADTVCDSQNHHHQPKKCRFKGCSKGARGASGLCIAHGGGQRCQKPGCNKGAESRTAFCKAHGGGRRCQELGCTKSAEGKTDFCIAHGGGRRCGHEGCTRAARGKSGLCIRHGGGKRCAVEGCTRSAEGQAGLCISHGGGRRCQYLGCNKGAQGSTMHCKAHGGGKRCIFEGCTKGAEGSTPLCKGHGGGKRCLYEGGGVCPKSVHGGTDYCVAHGGGKRCAVPGCTKSARGRTNYCVRHGGGKRCKFDGCGKSAQGSTDFCKAHGGGKRCSWAQGCEKFARGKSGLCAAHGSMMAVSKDIEAGKNGNMITSALFHGLVSASTTLGSSVDNDYKSSPESASESNTRMTPLLIPPQVLVPYSMKFSSGTMGAEGVSGSRENSQSQFAVPEGRVHGGGLMSLLGGSFHNVNVGDGSV